MGLHRLVPAARAVPAPDPPPVPPGHPVQDRFAAFACGGVAVYFLTHIVINLAMVCGLFPVVGIPLPS
jgi:hypothetical protein